MGRRKPRTKTQSLPIPVPPAAEHLVGELETIGASKGSVAAAALAFACGDSTAAQVAAIKKIERRFYAFSTHSEVDPGAEAVLRLLLRTVLYNYTQSSIAGLLVSVLKTPVVSSPPLDSVFAEELAVAVSDGVAACVNLENSGIDGLGLAVALIHTAASFVSMDVDFVTAAIAHHVPELLRIATAYFCYCRDNDHDLVTTLASDTPTIEGEESELDSIAAANRASILSHSTAKEATKQLVGIVRLSDAALLSALTDTTRGAAAKAELRSLITESLLALQQPTFPHGSMVSCALCSVALLNIAVQYDLLTSAGVVAESGGVQLVPKDAPAYRRALIIELCAVLFPSLLPLIGVSSNNYTPCIDRLLPSPEAPVSALIATAYNECSPVSMLGFVRAVLADVDLDILVQPLSAEWSERDVGATGGGGGGESCDSDSVGTLLVDGLFEAAKAGMQSGTGSHVQFYALEFLEAWLAALKDAYAAADPHTVGSGQGGGSGGGGGGVSAENSEEGAFGGGDLFGGGMFGGSEASEEDAAVDAAGTGGDNNNNDDGGVAESQVVEVDFAPFTQITDDVLATVLGFAWANWNDSGSGVPQLVQNTLAHLVDIHFCRNTRTAYFERASVDAPPEFLVQLCTEVIALPWQKGKGGALTALIPRLGASFMLDIAPNFVYEVLSALQNVNTQHTSAIVLKTFLDSLRGECARLEGDERRAAYLKPWLPPVLRLVCDDEADTDAATFCIPVVLEDDSSNLSSLISALKLCGGGTGGSGPVLPEATIELIMGLGLSKSLCDLGLIAILRTAQTLQLLPGYALFGPPEGAEIAQFAEFQVPLDIVRACLCHSSVRVRCDAFELVCGEPRLTYIPTQVEYELVRSSLGAAMKSYDRNFIKRLVEAVKMFHARIRVSLGAARRAGDEDMANAAQGRAEVFLTWFVQFCVEQLYPGAMDRREKLAVELVLASLSEWTGAASKSKYIDASVATPLFDWDLTAALLRTLLTDYDETRRLAAKALALLPTPAFLAANPRSAESLLCQALRMTSSPRSRRTEAGARLLAFVYSSFVRKLGWSVAVADDTVAVTPHGGGEDGESGSVDSDGAREAARFFSSMLDHLDSHIAVAKDDLPGAAVSHPMHGVLQTLRFLVAATPASAAVSGSAEAQSQWRALLHRAVECAYTVAGLVLPVLRTFQSFDEEATTVDAPDVSESWAAIDAYAAVHRVTAVCAWLSIKEAVHLVSDVITKFPLADTGDGPEPVFATSDVTRAGDLFISVLESCTHRGGLEKSQAGVNKLCTRLLTSRLEELNSLPKQWLDHLLGSIETSHGSDVTRRSAGFPFVFVAILKAEPNGPRPLLGYTVEKLLEVAQRSYEGTETDAQVHALNVLRVIFRERFFSHGLTPQMEAAYKIAVSGVASPSFNLRNTSTLTFSGLIDRTIGAKSTSDQHSVVNFRTSRAFFSRFPSLHPYLCEVLSAAADDSKGSRLHPSLFPVLVLLSHLVPAPLDTADQSLDTSKFVPLVLACTSLPSYHGRVMAARALVPLVVDVPAILTTLLSTLPVSPPESGFSSASAVHGALLAALFVIRGHAHTIRNRDVATAVDSVLEEFFAPRLWLLDRRAHECSPIRELAVLLCDEGLLRPFRLYECTVSAVSVLTESVLNLCSALKGNGWSHRNIGLESADEKSVRVLLQWNFDEAARGNGGSDRAAEWLELLVKCAAHPWYEVRRATFESLLEASESHQFAMTETATPAQLLGLTGDAAISETQYDCKPLTLRAVAFAVRHSPVHIVTEWARVGELWTTAVALVRESTIEPVVGAAVELVGCLAPKLLSAPATAAESATSLPDSIASDLIAVLALASDEGQLEEIRGGAVAALRQCLPALCAHPSVVGSNFVELWASVFSLVEDDSEDLREATAVIVSQLVLGSRTGTQEQPLTRGGHAGGSQLAQASEAVDTGCQAVSCPVAVELGARYVQSRVWAEPSWWSCLLGWAVGPLAPLDAGSEAAAVVDNSAADGVASLFQIESLNEYLEPLARAQLGSSLLQQCRENAGSTFTKFVKEEVESKLVGYLGFLTGLTVDDPKGQWVWGVTGNATYFSAAAAALALCTSVGPALESSAGYSETVNSFVAALLGLSDCHPVLRSAARGLSEGGGSVEFLLSPRVVPYEPMLVVD